MSILNFVTVTGVEDDDKEDGDIEDDDIEDDDIEDDDGRCTSDWCFIALEGKLASFNTKDSGVEISF